MQIKVCTVHCIIKFLYFLDFNVSDGPVIVGSSSVESTLLTKIDQFLGPQGHWTSRHGIFNAKVNTREELVQKVYNASNEMKVNQLENLIRYKCYNSRWMSESVLVKIDNTPKWN